MMTKDPLENEQNLVIEVRIYQYKIHVIHGDMNYGQKCFMPMWYCDPLLSVLMANDAPSVTSVTSVG